MSYWQEKQSIKWTTVIGNGKRMARKWRQQAVMGEKDIIDYTGRERTVYAPGISENGMIVDDDLMRTWLPQWGESKDMICHCNQMKICTNYHNIIKHSPR